MGIVLGLIAALAYGLSDFVAGLLSRRVHYALVALVGNAAATSLTVAALAATAPPAPGVQALAWGAASGIGSGFGTLMLFRGLALGRMGVVAPLSGVGTAVLPVLIGIGLGDRPSPIAWVGVALALPGIWLVSTSGRPAADNAGALEAISPPVKRHLFASGAVEGLLAGLGFALLLVGLNFAGDGAGLWPVAAGQVSAVMLLAIVLVGTVGRIGGLRLARRDVAGAVSVGAISAIAAISYFLSTQAGLLSIVAVLTALYPAATVVLARIVLDEAISRRQATGLLLAGVAVALIVLG